MKSACLIIGFFWCGLFTYSQKINPKLLTGNPDYSSGWWDGYEQCTYAVDHDVI